ncbi:MAG: Flavobacterium phage vB FspS tooticki6 [Bacteroidota bacterium]|jgi:hypothetical protein
MTKITGLTLINHSIRVDLDLSLQQYVVMDFMSYCWDKRLNPESNSIELIAIEFDKIIPYISLLREKGLLSENQPTDKWLSCFVKTKKKKSKNEFIPPTQEDVISYFKEKGYSDIQAKKAFEYYSVADWKDRNGDKVVNWKQKMIANWMKEEHKVVNQSQSVSFEPKVYKR